MKPLKVEFQAFGPYRGHETVDFSLLSSKGLFLICGGTGTGKTTVLDAMTFALYGKSSGGLRDSFEQMRCKNADDKTDTFVRLEFENNGQVYLFERRLEKKRVNLHKSCVAKVKLPDGNWEVLFENPKEADLTKKAAEIIGLEYGQFVQVIILPQGKFEKLLVSTTDEKEKILTSIFGEEMWQQIADKLYAETTERKESLKGVKEKVRISLMEENCDSLDGLRQVIKEKTESATLLKTEFEKADYDGLIKKNSELVETATRFDRLDELTNRLNILNDRKAARESAETVLNEAKNAGKVKPYISAEEECKKSVEKRTTELKTCEEKAESARMKKEAASENLKAHVLKESEIEKTKTVKLSYESKEEAYKEIGAVKAEVENAEKAELSARALETVAKEKVTQFDEKIVNLQTEYKTLSDEHKHLLAAYIEGITGELAANLNDGDECPVCGSTSHPHKAEIHASNATKEEVELKKSEVDAKYDELNTAIENKGRAEKEANDIHERVEGLHNLWIQCKAKYDGMKDSLNEDISSYDDLISRIDELTEEIEAYGRKKEQYENAAKKTGEEHMAALSVKEAASKELKNALEKLETASLELNNALKEAGIDTVEEAINKILTDEKMAEITKQCADYDSQVKYCKEELCKLETELEGKEKPDAAVLKSQMDEAYAAKETFASKYAVINKELEDLTEKDSRLSKELEGLDEKINEAETDWAVAKKLRGDTGVGLQRYVLGIMFSQVVAEANKMLQLFNGGRYRLFRSDEKFAGSNKCGLELKVIDKYSDDKEGRFVHTLSGGEKFLTSLALSIGMSSVAKRGGIKIDAMFIDEGFGTLDTDCVNDAMNILTSIQEANGIVGIISHMQLLKERIATKLVATDDGNGSHLVQTVG